jgi:hypothetical protein
VSSKVGGQIWSNVFFSFGEISLFFQQRNWDFFGKLCVSSANSINFTLKRNLVKFCQKKNGKKKCTNLEGGARKLNSIL